MTAAEFWDLTPRETVMFIEADAFRRDQQSRMALWAVWHVEALRRQERLQPLSQLVRERKRRVRMLSDAEAVAYFERRADRGR